MSLTPVFNSIVWDADSGPRLNLRLTGPWVRTCGIGPDANVAIVSWRDWERVNPAKLIGTVKFFYSSSPVGKFPDVSLKGIHIIDVQPETYGVRADATQPPIDVEGLPVEIVAYKVTFADMRHLFAHPFGGRLTLGDINKTPLTVGGSQDANGHDILNPQQLARECFKKMGVDPKLATASLSDMPTLYDLEWRGNHAPTELEKILQQATHAACVDTQGKLKIVRIGKGVEPQVPLTSRVAEMPFQAIERRGKSVAYTSAPNAIIETKTIVGPYDGDGNDSWEFVVQDPDGVWQTLDKTPWFKGDSDAMVQLQGHLAKIPPGFLGSVSGQLFRCIRLNQDNYGPSPLNNTMIVDDRGRPADLRVSAKIAQVDANGVWSNSKDFIQCRIFNLYDQGRVIHLADALVKVDTPVLGSLAEHAILIGNNDLQVRCTRELCKRDDQNRWVPQYYEVGFTQALGGPVAVTGDALANLIDGGSTPVYRVPSLRLINVDGTNINEQRLQRIASNLANEALTGSGDPAKQIVVKGFFAGDLDGLVGKISYHQDQPRTVFETKTFFLSPSEHLPRFQSVDAQQPSEKFPQQSTVAGARADAGQAGYTRQTSIIQSWPADPAPPSLVKVKITATTDARGKYWGVIVGGASTADDSTALTEPEGMTDGSTTVLVMNLSEDVAHIFKGGLDHLLELGQYYLGKLVGVQTDGVQIVEIDCERCGLGNLPNGQIVHLGSTDTHNETAMLDTVETADRKSIDIWVPSRPVYNASGDKVLYMMFRKWAFACGKLTTIGAEQRFTVFTTGPC